METQKIAALEELFGSKTLLLPKSSGNTGREKESTRSTTTTSISALLEYKQVILYFSAHWCPPCKVFTPKLSLAYQKYKEKCQQQQQQQETQVIFISSDTSEKEFEKYYYNSRVPMSFPALSFHRETNQSLSELFQVDGIPCMVAFDPNNVAVDKSTYSSDGNATTSTNDDDENKGKQRRRPKSIDGINDNDFRPLIEEFGSAAFPLTPQRMKEIRTEKHTVANDAWRDVYESSLDSDDEKNAVTIFASNKDDGGKKTTEPFSDLLQNYDHVGLLLGEGDDGPFDDVLREITTKLNEGKEKKNSLAVIYVPWKNTEKGNDDDGSGKNGVKDDSLPPTEAADRTTVVTTKTSFGHDVVGKKFDYYIQPGISNKLRFAISTVLGGKPMSYQTGLIVLRQGRDDICNIDGVCEMKGMPIVIAFDCWLMRIAQSGIDGYPWDETSMKVYNSIRDERIKTIQSNFKNFKFLRDLSAESYLMPTKTMKNDNEHPIEMLFETDSVTDETNGGDIVGRANDDGGGVLGIYFSAHWCPPCQQFTPKLLSVYETLKRQNKKFEVLFVSSDGEKKEFEEYYNTSMKTTDGKYQFMALDYEKTTEQYREELNEAFSVEGIPSLVLLNAHDGSIISTDGRQYINDYGPGVFPWDGPSVDVAQRKLTEQRERESRDALQKEANDAKVARDAGLPVVKRISGRPRDVNHTVLTRVVTFTGFATIGCKEELLSSMTTTTATTMTDTATKSSSGNILYFEVEIVAGMEENDEEGCPQFGFAVMEQKDDSTNDDTDATMPTSNELIDIGVGDTEGSWAVDGGRCLKWNEGEEEAWHGVDQWVNGNVIGLAANIERGMIAVSLNGDWGINNGDGSEQKNSTAYGVVFQSDTIKHGVYPCLSCDSHTIQYNFGSTATKTATPATPFKYGPPPELVWTS